MMLNEEGMKFIDSFLLFRMCILEVASCLL